MASGLGKRFDVIGRGGQKLLISPWRWLEMHLTQLKANTGFLFEQRLFAC